MRLYQTRKKLTYSLFVFVLTGFMAVEVGLACWQPSSPYNELNSECRFADMVCVEWDSGESGEQPVATDCCLEGTLDCYCDNMIRLTMVVIQETIDSWIKTPSKQGESSHHVSPRIPIFVDHVPISPEDIHQFDGMPLHFMMCRPEGGQLDFQAFTTREGLDLQLRECTLGRPLMRVREVPEQATSGIVFHDDEGWGGAAYFLPAGQSMALAETWWDERMSSLRGFGAGTVVTLFENTDFSGSTLTLTTDLSWPNLSVLGWDGRVSAVAVWPAPLISYKPIAKSAADE